MWDFVGPERKLLNCKDRIIRGKTMLAYINHSGAYTYVSLQTQWLERAWLIGTACQNASVTRLGGWLLCLQMSVWQLWDCKDRIIYSQLFKHASISCLCMVLAPAIWHAPLIGEIRLCTDKVVEQLA